MKLCIDVLRKAFQNILNNHMMIMAAGLSYYFILSLFPLLILLASLVGYLPIPNLFDQIMDAMAAVVPPDSMGLVRAIVGDVITPSKGKFLTIGIAGTLWAASGGFAAVIEALNVAYDVPETRRIWKTRLLAVGLMLVVGALLIIAIAVIFVGPQFGGWLADKVHLQNTFVQIWPVLRWTVAIVFTVFAVELIFFWAPNVQQRHFWATLPGAALGVGFWIGASYALSLYFRNFANFNKTYGTLGAAIALLVWLYWSWLMILAGAEINSELLKAMGEKLPVKELPEEAVEIAPPGREAA